MNKEQFIALLNDALPADVKFTGFSVNFYANDAELATAHSAMRAAMPLFGSFVSTFVGFSFSDRIATIKAEVP